MSLPPAESMYQYDKICPLCKRNEAHYSLLEDDDRDYLPPAICGTCMQERYPEEWQYMLEREASQ